MSKSQKSHFQGSSFQNFLRDHVPGPRYRLGSSAIKCPSPYFKFRSAVPENAQLSYSKEKLLTGHKVEAQFAYP